MKITLVKKVEHVIKVTEKSPEQTKTLENTSENINMLERQGYEKSPVSKPNGMSKVLRYNLKKGVYWFSSSKSAHKSDCYFTRQKVRTIYIN